ncbi:23S rRNA (uracil(1939)-C(5))-methyltransferase RlmD [Candidatus Atelocyanobacterium thalassae]|uniref:23S rRNA (Uracil-C(5))-methyltransferase RlmCD n=1 Tax=cyanobacterium endosymbiont of Braarudosphaera bigelowii TaxID=1285375 RepID=A0ABN6JZV2_9CHRO|nr:23S rRNA (uracil(1939)-C(5))-methyltransferase RlmD [Candidatus Atelocyanobacterium thalassa]BDA39422.1 23S rRNA (uracil-C(5))-methyltransferase RlmCD [cyanobacterium endosymbiont of Braarudosphaera bigelowii]
MSQQNNLIKLNIVDINDNGEGVGKFEEKIIFVPDTVTGDVVLVSLNFIKRQYAYGKVKEIIHSSPYRVRPNCIVSDKCGGCQWQHISPEYQLHIKQNKIVQSLRRIGRFKDISVLPILSSSEIFGYRNKATYPLSYSKSGNVHAGYYQRHTHKLININQCPIQDSRLNSFLAEIKLDIEKQRWTIYNEKTYEGQLRHLALRIGHSTGEVLLTLVSTSSHINEIKKQANLWLEKYPNLIGVLINQNSEKSNKIFGDKTFSIVGEPFLKENFFNIDFKLRPDTFFQVNTQSAETLLHSLLDNLILTGKEKIVDAYCGIGTFTLPLAKRVSHATGIEISYDSIEQAKTNAKANNIDNVVFYQGAVKDILPSLNISPDIVLLDPPRKGCEDGVIETLRRVRPPLIIYISCQPSTLARDLKKICHQNLYKILWIQPVDFFPQTPHVESIVAIRHIV